jgi:hypothetical protein
MTHFRPAAIAFAAALLLGACHGHDVPNEPAVAFTEPAADLVPVVAVRDASTLDAARAALAVLTAADPQKVTVGSLGRDDGAAELHLVLDNRGDCAVTSAAGIAYGFDATGRTSSLQPNGSAHVSFAVQLDPPLAPGEHRLVANANPMFANATSVVIAHVDRSACANGKGWRR